tara:strand:+ start:150 stop:596 length:447 start_codon:yes stop_codon:yes gene_type:complete
MNKPLVIGYRHTGIIVKNMKESLYFYRDILGLEVIQEFFDDSEYINKITGITNANVHAIKLKSEDETILEIIEYTNHPTELVDQEIYNAGACHVAFQVKNINEVYAILKEKNVEVISEPVLSSEKIAKVFFCLDPNKVRIEIVEMLES